MNLLTGQALEDELNRLKKIEGSYEELKTHHQWLNDHVDRLEKKIQRKDWQIWLWWLLLFLLCVAEVIGVINVIG